MRERERERREGRAFLALFKLDLMTEGNYFSSFVLCPFLFLPANGLVVRAEKRSLTLVYNNFFLEATLAKRERTFRPDFNCGRKLIIRPASECECE